MSTLTVRQQAGDRIATLFCEGKTLDGISELGAVHGWTRADAEAVAKNAGWELDGSGRIPRQHWIRPSAPPGQPKRPQRRRGDTYVAAISTRDLFVDGTYQRPLDHARVDRMVRQFTPRMLGVLDVSDRGPDAHPRFAIINGQHRAAAADLAMADPHLVCNVHEGLTVQAEAQLMYDLDKATKKLNGWEQWHARHGAGDERVLAVEKVAARHGLRVNNVPVDGSVRSYGTCEKLLTIGGEQLLDQALGVLKAAYGDMFAAYQAPLLMAVGRLLHQHGAGVDVDRLARALAATRPEMLRATATSLREVHAEPLHSLMARAVTAAYNRTPGPKLGRAA